MPLARPVVSGMAEPVIREAKNRKFPLEKGDLFLYPFSLRIHNLAKDRHLWRKGCHQFNWWYFTKGSSFG
jgi:hypothetical protein